MVNETDDPVEISPEETITHSILILDEVHGFTDHQLVDALVQILPNVEPQMSRELEKRGLIKRIKMALAFYNHKDLPVWEQPAQAASHVLCKLL